MTNVVATASTTLGWLQATPSVAIPVYQREYRWRQESCAQLLTDIRRVADEPPGHSHFIGSILATPEESGGVTLVDGQQRVTTIMLMLAAIRAHATGQDDAVANAIAGLTLQTGTAKLPRLRTHNRSLDVMTALMAGEPVNAGLNGPPVTTFEENFLYFYDRLTNDWRTVWEGLHRLEQVTITLQPNASAQQIFESLNSTGATLSDDELIHNYIHMGRTHEDQLKLEQETWAPIEEATHGEIRAFWRDYLVLTAATQPDLTGDFGIYRAFRRLFPDPRADLTAELRDEWLRLARHYGILVRPTDEADPEVRDQLDLLRAFEGAPRPLLLAMYDDYARQRMDKPSFLSLLELVQTLFIRRALVGLPRDIGLAGALCRELRVDRENLLTSLIRRAPEDPAVRLALTHSSLPLAGYILRRLQRPADASGLQVEHIYPQTPRGEWTGGGVEWKKLSNEEQARYRTLLNTIGNLTLLEGRLNAGAGNRSFREKKVYYARSKVKETRRLSQRATWDAINIVERTHDLVEKFLVTWPRPINVSSDEPQELVRVVDLVVPRDSNADPDRFEYVVFKGEIWGDVHDVRALHFRITQALDRLDSVRLRTAEYGDLIKPTKQPGYAGPLDDGSYLYQRWWPCYLLEVVQARITTFELDDEVKVRLLELAEPPGLGTA